MFVAFALVLAGPLAAAPGVRPPAGSRSEKPAEGPSERPAQGPSKAELRAMSRELQALYDDDQRDQLTPDADALTPAFLGRQKVRRDRLYEILAAGGVRTPTDCLNGAMLLQHGAEIGDYVNGHILASMALFDGGDLNRGNFLCTVTLDRYLLFQKKKACFGTQGLGEYSQPTFALSPALQREYGLDSVMMSFTDASGVEHRGGSDPEGGRGHKKKKKPFKSRDLGRKYKEHVRDSKKADAGDEKAAARCREHLDWAMQLVAEGELKKGAEYAQAAEILYDGESSEHFLAAHVLAVVAARKGAPGGRELAAQTLDRWLLSIGRPQRFGTETEPDESGAETPVEPWDRVLPDHVRAAYGLAPLQSAENP